MIIFMLSLLFLWLPLQAMEQQGDESFCTSLEIVKDGKEIFLDKDRVNELNDLAVTVAILSRHSATSDSQEVVANMLRPKMRWSNIVDINNILSTKRGRSASAAAKNKIQRQSLSVKKNKTKKAQSKKKTKSTIGGHAPLKTFTRKQEQQQSLKSHKENQASGVKLDNYRMVPFNQVNIKPYLCF